MGRQIHFHILEEDRDRFVRHITRNGIARILPRYSDSSPLREIDRLDQLGVDTTYCLWNPALAPVIKRHLVPETGSYALDILHDPILEFDSSRTGMWQKHPSITQGRLYGIFDAYLGKPKGFLRWYEELVRWIRKNFKKNPTGESGYTGPSAFKLFEAGGYLLPYVRPLETAERAFEIEQRHSQARGAKRN